MMNICISEKHLDTIEDHHNKHINWLLKINLADGSQHVATFKKCVFRQQLDTIEDHQNKHIVIN